jgi:hypothetical protein
VILTIAAKKQTIPAVYATLIKKRIQGKKKQGKRLRRERRCKEINCRR